MLVRQVIHDVFVGELERSGLKGMGLGVVEGVEKLYGLSNHSV